MKCIKCTKEYKPRIPSSKYCSRHCYQTGRSAPYITKTCIQCPKQFSVPPCLERVTHCSVKCRYKTLSKSLSGSRSHLWRGGITPLLQRKRQVIGPQLREWRRHVFLRDNYTCQGCAQRGGELQADHELPFSLYPALRFEVLNGRTFCKPCHLKYGWNIFKEANPRGKALPN